MPPARCRGRRESESGNRVDAGIGKAAVLSITSRFTRSAWRTAHVKPMSPPQSWTTSVTSRVTPALSSKALMSLDALLEV